MITLPTKRSSVISMIVLLALLLLFGSEILAWTNPTGRPLLEWLLLIPGYVVLSAVLLDFIVRYRVQDLFGALLLAGLYALAAALILNPSSMLNDLPRTLFTRVMGAHALITAEMIGLFLALTGGNQQIRRNLLIGCAIVGLAWGIWVKNWPLEEGYGAVSLATMLAFGVGGIVLIALYLYVVAPNLQSDTSEEITPATDHDPLTGLCLNRRNWLLVIGIIAVLLIVRYLQGQLNTVGLIVCPVLIILCWGILWFRERKRGNTLLDHHLPMRPLPPPSVLIAAAVFLAVGIFAYNLPDIKMGSVTPYRLIGLGFTAYGLAWLPTVSLVLGVQGYLRQLATRKM